MLPEFDAFGQPFTPPPSDDPNAEPRERLALAPIPQVSADAIASVAIVVTVYNQPHLVRACLRALHARTPIDAWIIIMDNASNDYTLAMLRDEMETMNRARDGRCTLHRNETNLGYTKSANRGFRAAFGRVDHPFGKADIQWGVALNSDFMVTRGWLERLLSAAQANPKYGFICPWMSCIGSGDQRNPLQIGIAPGTTYLDMAERMAALSPPTAIAPQAVPIGACMMVSRAAWEKIGSFDEAIGKAGGAYGEECDAAMRALAKPSQIESGVALACYGDHLSHGTYGKEAPKLELAGYQDFVARHGEAFRVRKQVVKPHDQKPRLESRARHVRIEDDGPAVTFYLQGVLLCGGVLAIVNLCNQMIERGIRAGIVYKRDDNRHWKLMPARFAPVQVDNVQQWMSRGGFPCGVVMATDWRTGQDVADLCARHPGLIAGAFVQDREDWFRTSKGYLAMSSPQTYEAFLAIARKRCVYNSRWVGYSMMRDHGVPESAATWIGIGTDPDMFYDRGIRTPGIGTTADPVRILSFSRPMTPRRGAALLAYTYRRLHERYGQRVKLLTYGDLPELAIPSHHLGVLPQKDLAIEMARAHALLEPSISQGWGMAAHEAMASGASVISHSNGGISDYAEHDVSALIAPGRDGEQDPEAFFALACRVVEDASLRARIGTEARKAACRFSWESQGRLFADWVAKQCALHTHV